MMADVVKFEEPAVPRGASALFPEEWQDGWALMSFNKPHWFKIEIIGDEVFLESLCGRRYSGSTRTTLFDAGNFPRCKRCIAALRRKATPPPERNETHEKISELPPLWRF